MDDAVGVVPDVTRDFPAIPTSFMQAVPVGLPGFGGKAGFDGAGAVPSLTVPGAYPPQPHSAALVVPQLGPGGFSGRLTASQQAELELARRRAQKAAEGKRANATAARRAKRRAQQRAEVGSDKEEDDAATVPGSAAARSPETEAGGPAQTESDIERKLANVEDQKEAKRLKRLLRNRVSAQQARERKKSYVQDLEAKAREQEQRLAQLESRVKVLERENGMLRSVIKNMQAGGGPAAPAS